jgi:hypothetical protein
VRQHCTWEYAGEPFFDGEVEPCINGGTVAIGAYFGENVEGVVVRLLGEQLDDGGWNCEAERGSTRSSFHSTMCVLEGLLEYERAGGTMLVGDARRRGEGIPAGAQPLPPGEYRTDRRVRLAAVLVPGAVAL